MNESLPPQSPVREGQIVAQKYRVENILGVGAMGAVVRATHIELDQPVALKFMLPESMQSTEAVARFLREGKIVARLKSEHIVRVSDLGTLDTGQPFIVMELLEGSDLRQRDRSRPTALRRRGRRLRDPSMRRIGGGARKRNRASRSQTREPIS